MHVAADMRDDHGMALLRTVGIVMVILRAARGGWAPRRRPAPVPDRGPARASAGDGEEAGLPCDAGAARRPGPTGVRPHRVAGPGRIRPRPRGSPGTTAGARRTTRRRPGPGYPAPRGPRRGGAASGSRSGTTGHRPSPLPFRRLRTAPALSVRRRRPERFTRQVENFLKFSGGRPEPFPMGL